MLALRALGAAVAQVEPADILLDPTTVKFILVMSVRNFDLDLDVEDPRAVTLDRAHLLVRSTISKGEVRNMALNLPTILLGNAVAPLDAVVGRMLRGGLVSLNVNVNVLILVAMVELVEIEHKALVLEVEANLA